MQVVDGQEEILAHILRTKSENMTWDMVGPFSSTSKTRSLLNLPAHYKARLKTRFYKINTWTSGKVTIIIDGSISISDSRLDSWGINDSFYYGDMCNGGAGNGNEDTFYIDQEFLHFGSTISIVFSGTPAANAYWGFSHVGVYLYLCDYQCKTCIGPAASQCDSCKTNYYLYLGQVNILFFVLLLKNIVSGRLSLNPGKIL